MPSIRSDVQKGPILVSLFLCAGVFFLSQCTRPAPEGSDTAKKKKSPPAQKQKKQAPTSGPARLVHLTSGRPVSRLRAKVRYENGATETVSLLGSELLVLSYASIPSLYLSSEPSWSNDGQVRTCLDQWVTNRRRSWLREHLTGRKVHVREPNVKSSNRNGERRVLLYASEHADTSLNRKMIRNGLTGLADDPMAQARKKRFENALQQARRDGAGLWNCLQKGTRKNKQIARTDQDESNTASPGQQSAEPGTDTENRSDQTTRTTHSGTDASGLHQERTTKNEPSDREGAAASETTAVSRDNAAEQKPPTPSNTEQNPDRDPRTDRRAAQDQLENERDDTRTATRSKKWERSQTTPTPFDASESENEDRFESDPDLNRSVRKWWTRGNRLLSRDRKKPIRKYIKKLLTSDTPAKTRTARLLMAKAYMDRDKLDRATDAYRTAANGMGDDETLKRALRDPIREVRRSLVGSLATKQIETANNYLQNKQWNRLKKRARGLKKSEHPQLKLLGVLMEIKYHVRRGNKRKAVRRMDTVERARTNSDRTLVSPIRTELTNLQQEMGEWKLVRNTADRKRPESRTAEWVLSRGMRLVRRGKTKAIRRAVRELSGTGKAGPEFARKVLMTYLLVRRGRTQQARKGFQTVRKEYRRKGVEAADEKSDGKTCCGNRTNRTGSAKTAKIRQGPAVQQAMAGLYREVSEELIKALRIYDRVGKKREDLQRVYAAEGMSDTFLQMGVPRSNIKKALRWINFGLDHLKYLQQKNSQTGSNEKRPETRVVEATAGPQRDWKQKSTKNHRRNIVRKRLRRKKREIRKLLNVLEHGLGFYLYKKAHRAQLNGNWKKALTRWNELIEKANNKKDKKLEDVVERGTRVRMDQLKDLTVSPIYREAALVYREKCRVQLGEYRKAFANLQQFVKKEENDYRLYEGEALRVMADVALEYMYRPRKARPLYTRAVKWFRTVKEHDRKVASFTVPTKAKGVTAPPNKFRKVEGWGNVTWSDPKPGDVINRNTAGWYLDYNRMMARTHRSLCYFIRSFYENKEKNRKKALEDIKVINEVDPHSRRLSKQNRPSNYLRLRDGYRIGKLFATKAEQKHFRSDRSEFVGLMVGDMHYEMERWKQALTAYRRFIDRFAGGHLKNLPKAQEAYLTYVIGNCTAMVKKSETAKEILKRFLTRYKNTPTWPRVMLTLDSYYTYSDQKYEILKRVYKRMQGTKYAIRALYRMGRWSFTDKKPKQARRYFRKVMEEAKTKSMKERARSYLEDVDYMEKHLEAP